MANSDSPRGMWPLRHLTGGEIRTSEYGLTAGSGQLLTKGDPVERLAAGTIDRAEATDTMLGVFAGASYKDASGNYHYSDQIVAARSSYTELKAYVWDDPFIVFGIQAAGSIAAADVFTLRKITIGSGNTTTKLSICEISAASGSGGLTVLGKIDRPDNAWGSNVDVEVMIS